MKIETKKCKLSKVSENDSSPVASKQSKETKVKSTKRHIDFNSSEKQVKEPERQVTQRNNNATRAKEVT